MYQTFNIFILPKIRLIPCKSYYSNVKSMFISRSRLNGSKKLMSVSAFVDTYVYAYKYTSIN